MTLYRQLFIFTFILFLLLCTGTWIAQLNSTRNFLTQQMASHSQDTATSLGLSLSPYMEQPDLPAVETIINAVFDSGYYRTIRLVDMKDRVLIDRTLDLHIEGIPQWFTSTIKFISPKSSAMVLGGWHQTGTIEVESHPGYAYKTLWETGANTSLWFFLMGALVITVGGMGLRLLLKPLVRIEHQANNICERQYDQQETLPRTRELRRVVEAMNRMSEKVKDMFNEQMATAERLRENAYSDPLTGLGNRRYLERQITTRLNRGDNRTKGAFLLLELKDLHNLNQQRGFQAGDIFIQKAGDALQQTTMHIANGTLARLNGGNFAIFLPDTPLEEAQAVAKTVTRNLVKLAAESLALSNNVSHTGGVSFDQQTDFTQLLSGADIVLRSAQQDGENRWRVEALTKSQRTVPQNQQEWKDILAKAITDKDIVLLYQKVVPFKKQTDTFHHEVFSRIRSESGTLLSAGMFVPLAIRFEMIAMLDKIVIEQAMNRPVETLGTEKVAVNVSTASLRDDNFRNWLLKSLQKLRPTAPRLIFEFAEYSAVQNLSVIQKFGNQVHQLGHGYALDHFGQGFSNFGYLKSLRPDYIKIDRAYTDELQTQDSDSYFFIASLINVAHSLDIQVIAEGVETEMQFNLLKQLNIDAVQGFFVERPKPFAERSG